MNSNKDQKVLIVDFGSQVTQLIARRIRELAVYCEIISYQKFNKLNTIENVKGIILSGGPSSISKKNSPYIKNFQLINKIPILAICYGHQLIAKIHGGKVKFSNKKEFGRAILFSKFKSPLTKNFFKNKKAIVWMSHSDEVTKLPNGFSVVASTKNSSYAMTQNLKKKFLQYSFIPR